jgi:hypothetical protein
VVPTGRKRPFGRNWFREHLCFSVYPVSHPTHQREIGWPIGAQLEFSYSQSEITTAEKLKRGAILLVCKLKRIG